MAPGMFGPCPCLPRPAWGFDFVLCVVWSLIRRQAGMSIVLFASAPRRFSLPPRASPILGTTRRYGAIVARHHGSVGQHAWGRTWKAPGAQARRRTNRSKDLKPRHTHHAGPLVPTNRQCVSCQGRMLAAAEAATTLVARVCAGITCTSPSGFAPALMLPRVFGGVGWLFVQPACLLARKLWRSRFGCPPSLEFRPSCRPENWRIPGWQSASGGRSDFRRHVSVRPCLSLAFALEPTHGRLVVGVAWCMCRGSIWGLLKGSASFPPVRPGLPGCSACCPSPA